jgi:hypothetical protein
MSKIQKKSISKTFMSSVTGKFVSRDSIAQKCLATTRTVIPAAWTAQKRGKLEQVRARNNQRFQETYRILAEH